MKFTKLTVFALALVAMMIAHPSMAQDKKGMFGNVVETFMPPKGDGAKMIAKELELDEEQRPKMRELNERFKRNVSTLRQAYQQEYQNVVALMNSESPNKSNVNAKLKSFHAMHQKVLDAEVGYWMDLKEILTPAQNLKLWEIFEKQRIRR